jgi:thiamine biosynthesis protein ThiS
MARDVESGTIQVHINGKLQPVASGTTITGLLGELGIRPDHVAVEINLEIMDRREFDRRVLQAEDRVEVISFIGGGTGE